MNYKEKYLNLLGSKVFPDILEASILEPLKFNKLMVAHIVTIGAQCNGIKEGGCNIKYVTSTEEHFTPDVIGPKLSFYFYTNNNSLIEHTNRSTRSSSRITNLNDFSYSDFHNPWMLKDFILSQEIKMKHLPGHDWESIKDDYIDIKYKKPSKTERIDYFYEIIVSANKDIESFLNHYFIKSNLTTDESHKEKKMKL